MDTAKVFSVLSKSISLSGSKLKIGGIATSGRWKIPRLKDNIVLLASNQAFGEDSMKVFTEAESVAVNFLNYLEDIQSKKEKEALVAKTKDSASSMGDEGLRIYDSQMYASMESGSQADIMFIHNDTILRVSEDYALKVKGLTREEALSIASPVHIHFNPFSSDLLSVKQYHTSRNIEVSDLELNTYTAPLWVCRSKALKPDHKIFSPIAEFMSHLFPEKSGLEYVYDWLHYAITSRNNTMLCLIGPKGTGKTIFMVELIGALLGRDYTKVANGSILDTQFNSPLKNARAVILDEVCLEDQTTIDRCKLYLNDIVSIEEKGKDQKNYQNYASIILANNDIYKVKIPHTERRFSIPRVTAINLLTLWGEDRIQEFCEMLKDPKSEAVTHFAKFILDRKPSYNNNTPFRGAYYSELYQKSMKVWQRELVTLLDMDFRESGYACDWKIDFEIAREQLNKAQKRNKGSSVYAPSTFEKFFDNDHVRDPESGTEMFRFKIEEMGDGVTYVISATDEYIAYMGKLHEGETENKSTKDNSWMFAEDESEEEELGSL